MATKSPSPKPFTGRRCIFCKARDVNAATMHSPYGFFCSDEEKIMYLRLRTFKCQSKFCDKKVIQPIRCPCGQHIYCSQWCMHWDSIMKGCLQTTLPLIPVELPNLCASPAPKHFGLDSQFDLDNLITMG